MSAVLSPVFTPNDRPRRRKRRPESDEDASPTPVRDVAQTLAALTRLCGRVLRLYHQSFADAYASYSGGSILEFGSKNAESDQVGGAALGRDAARENCRNAAALVADALAKLRAAADALSPAPPARGGVKLEEPDVDETQRVSKDELARLRELQARRDRDA